MKSTIIFILLLALLAAAFFTRPTEADFKRYVSEKQTQGDTNVLKAGWDQFQADQLSKSCTFRDRILWTDVQQDGKTIYTGAFSHWFSRDAATTELKKLQNKAEKIKAAAKG